METNGGSYLPRTRRPLRVFTAALRRFQRRDRAGLRRVVRSATAAIPTRAETVRQALRARGGPVVTEARPLGTNVLVLAPSLSTVSTERCVDQAEALGPAATPILDLTFTDSPDRRIDVWQRRLPTPPPAIEVVAVGQTPGASGASDSSVRYGDDGRFGARTVDDPRDLTGIGIAVSETFDRWAEWDRAVVHVGELTTLLQYADTSTVFRFLHVLTNRLTEANAVAFYRLAPGAHDEQTVGTLFQLFDDAIRIEEA
jgi:hypothetical protein